MYTTLHILRNRHTHAHTDIDIHIHINIYRHTQILPLPLLLLNVYLMVSHPYQGAYIQECNTHMLACDIIPPTDAALQ
jgi:hypothetical protein